MSNGLKILILRIMIVASLKDKGITNEQLHVCRICIQILLYCNIDKGKQKLSYNRTFLSTNFSLQQELSPLP